MEQPVTFQKGMLPQIDILSMPEGSYLEALNMMRDESGSIITEVGTENSLNLGVGSKILGLENVGDDIVVASIRDGIPEIGILDADDNYTTSLSDSVLGFKADNKVRLESKISYKGDRVIYIAGKDIKLRSINLDDIPTEDIDKKTSLFLEYKLPQTGLSSVSSGGKVPSGIYQFCTRLVSKSNNTTAFGPTSGLIPIGVGTESDGRKDVDGAEPQTITQNSILVNVSNIDTSFEYIEPCVITYEGQANQLKIKSLGTFLIADREEITITYSGLSDETSTILETELNINSTYYESANYITQKDNTLLIAGLHESTDDTDWQSVANRISIKYVEHPIKHTEEISMENESGTKWEDLTPEQQATLGYSSVWTDVGRSGTFEDYKNPEICSKFIGYRRSEVYSFTFTPIFKGGRRGDAYHIPALSAGDVYNQGGNTENLLGYVETTSHVYPEEFGSFYNNPVRYHKMPSNAVSAFFYKTGDQNYLNVLGIATEILGSDTSWKDKLDGYIIGRENRVGKETITAQGFCKDIYTVDGGRYTFAHGHGNTHVAFTHGTDLTSESQIHKKIVTFHSPDLITDKSTDFIPSKISKIMDYNCRVGYAGSSQAIEDAPVNSLIVCDPGDTVEVNHNLNGGMVKIPTKSQSITDDERQGPDNDNLVSAIFDTQLYYRRVMECVALQSDTEITRNREFTDYWADDDQHIDPNRNSRWYMLIHNFTMQLYNLVVESSNYYGDVYDKVALPINTVIFETGSKNPITGAVLDNAKTVSFGGDTFISRYAIALKTTGPFIGAIGVKQNIPYSDVIVYTMVESNNNYNYRHYNEADDINPGTTPYYPKYKILFQKGTGLNNIISGLGNAELYNKQYSAQNILKPTYSKILGEDRITSFENREAYSATSIEGEKFDAFKLFLTANYHDIPKQFGRITGLFVQGNDLYAHTERGLWRSFYNNLATQATSEGDIILGNGGAFPRPSVPVLTVDGGYAGCKDIDASIGTPSGRYFIDTHRSKVYYLGDGLKEISNPAIFELLREKAYDKDFVLGYDYGRKRVMLASDALSLSYKPELSSFSSKHSYRFDNFISRDLKDYLSLDGLLDFYTKTKVGDYFGVISDSSIKMPALVGPALSKRFTSIYANLTAFNPANNKYLPKAFFDKFRAYSYERNTDWNNLEFIDDYLDEFETLGRVFVHKANNKIRLAFPPDLVSNIENDIFDETNLKNHSLFSDEDRLFLPDLIDAHIIMDFIQDNNIQKQLKINSFIVNFEQNIT